MTIIGWRHWQARNALIATLTKLSIVVLEIGGHRGALTTPRHSGKKIYGRI